MMLQAQSEVAQLQELSFSSWTACFGTFSVGRSHGKHVSVEWQLCINAFKFEFGNLYAVPELVIQVRIQLGRVLELESSCASIRRSKADGNTQTTPKRMKGQQIREFRER